MNKILSTTALLLIVLSSKAQSNSFGTLNLSGGLGAGLYATNSEVSATYLGGSLVIRDQDTSAAATTYAYLSGDYGVSKLFSAGFYLQSGSYLESDTNTRDRENHFFKLGIMPKFYIINRDRFNLYTGLGLGFVRLRTSEQDGNTKAEAKYAGSNLQVRLGLNAYFTKSIGMFFHLGYDGNYFDLKEYTFTSGNTTNTPSNLSGDLNAKGLEVAIGLNFKLTTAN
mgnify:CR=1 FL=1